MRELCPVSSRLRFIVILSYSDLARLHLTLHVQELNEEDFRNGLTFCERINNEIQIFLNQDLTNVCCLRIKLPFTKMVMLTDTIIIIFYLSAGVLQLLPLPALVTTTFYLSRCSRLLPCPSLLS